jgi:catechol 2,3-dioxygenase-like lactoylglutathione lyase family enzyme
MTSASGPEEPYSIGQIHISVNDVDQAVAWYRDVLGLEFLFQVPGQAMAFFNCGGVRLYLGRPENEAFRSRPVLYYRVARLEASVAKITGRGGEFTDQPHVIHRDDSHELWMAALKDPEGNPVILMEERPL